MSGVPNQEERRMTRTSEQVESDLRDWRTGPNKMLNHEAADIIKDLQNSCDSLKLELQAAYHNHRKDNEYLIEERDAERERADDALQNLDLLINDLKGEREARK